MTSCACTINARKKIIKSVDGEFSMLKRFIYLKLIAGLCLSSAFASETLDKVVAVVNDEVITESELNLHTLQMKKQILANKMQEPPESVLKKQVLQHLINVDLQKQLAKHNQFEIDDEELNNAINKIAASNNLSVTQLRKEITDGGLSWKDYRNNIREEILLAKVQQQAVSSSIDVSPEEIDDYFKTEKQSFRQKQTYHLKNIVVALPDEPTSDDIQKARAKANRLLTLINNGQDFSATAFAESSGDAALTGGDLGERHLAEMPDIFAKRVVHMKVGEVEGPIRAGNGFHLIKLVSIGNQEHHQVQKTHVRHILLKQDANMTSAEAKKQAENIYQQLKAGKAFSKMANQYSLDAVSAVNGGDLGWVVSEELVPEFAEAMNKLPLKKVSSPVRSKYGWHLIEVLERKTEDDSEAYQKQQVQRQLLQRKHAEAIQNWLQNLRSGAYVKILDKDLA